MIKTLLITATAIALAFAAPSFAQTPKKDDSFQISATRVILIDADSGTVLYEKAADELMEPSSMAKLMTVEVVFNALRQGRVKPDDEFIISENAWRQASAWRWRSAPSGRAWRHRSRPPARRQRLPRQRPSDRHPRRRRGFRSRSRSPS